MVVDKMFSAFTPISEIISQKCGCVIRRGKKLFGKLIGIYKTNKNNETFCSSLRVAVLFVGVATWVNKRVALRSCLYA